MKSVSALQVLSINMLWGEQEILTYFCMLYTRHYNELNKKGLVAKLVSPAAINIEFIRASINVNCDHWNLYNAAFDKLVTPVQEK